MSMTTPTPSRARAKLSALLRCALKDDDIGIVVDGRIVALRPVAVEATDDAARHYGVTESDLAGFEERTLEKIAKGRKAGKLAEFTGDLERLIAGTGH